MSTFKYEPYVCPELSAYAWRNSELTRTDILVAIPDHPQRAALLTYRADLRTWPSTSDFPDIPPELGS